MSDALSTPLAGPSPVGQDLTYDPALQALQAELEKGTSLSGGSVDWKLIQQESARLLREASKDLRCISWFVVATARLEGWPGAARGLDVYREVIDAHWEPMFPAIKRIRGRVALVEWLWQNLSGALAPLVVAPGDGDAVRATLASMRAIDESLAAKLGELNPGPGQLRPLVRETIAALPEVVVAPPPPPVVAPPVVPEAGAPPAVASPAQVVAPARAQEPDLTASDLSGSAEDLARRADTWRRGLFALAHAEREADPKNARSYRLTRTAAWLLADTMPELNGARTFVRAPRSADAKALRGVMDWRDWPTLRDEAEDAVSEHVFWLDLHRMVFVALGELGPDFAAAQRTVARETVSFVDRMTGLEALSFADGTPFADADTLLWLRSQRGAPAGASAGAPSQQGDEDVRLIVANARSRAGGDQAAEALSAAVVEATALSTPRSRFAARLALAQLAVERGKRQVGLALLEALLGEVDETLEHWEPELCADAIRTFLQVSAVRGAEPDSRALERRRLLFGRLLRLNPKSAIHLETD